MTVREGITRDLFYCHFLEPLELFFKDIYKENKPFEQIQEYALLDLDDDYSNFDRNIELFRRFYCSLKAEILKKVSKDENLMDVKFMESLMIQTMSKYHLGTLLAFIPDFESAEKEDVKDFSVRENDYRTLNTAYADYKLACNVQEIKQQSSSAENKMKPRKQLKAVSIK